MSTKKVSSESKKDKTQRRKSKTNRICKGVIINILKTFFTFFRLCMDYFVDFVLTLYWDGKQNAIPDLDKKHAILMESAVTLAEKIRKRELKSEDLVTACIERIKLVNPILNAVTDERYEDALKEARDVDKMIENGLSEEEFAKKPFLGVPFTAKESHAVKGMLHTLGIIARRDIRADEDAECVRLLRDAGAIPVAVTNVPEINKW
ncbi:unnamed protein product [Euphydryas editha]|nr:unnamed protein product [Euphydryas editha]